MKPVFSLSVVSHGHAAHVSQLVADLVRLGRDDIELILTLNLPEEVGFEIDRLPFQALLIENTYPKGFAANHNAAFKRSSGRNFVLLNPDIRLPLDPFERLLRLLNRFPECICAPKILNEEGRTEDSARNFPTPAYLLQKLVFRILKRPLLLDQSPECDGLLMPDWVAGMFMALPGPIFQKLGGLDMSYRMYYEDVDLCARARLIGCQILVDTKASAIHLAQRDSHRKLRYLLWHLKSAYRFFTSQIYRDIRRLRR